MRSAIPVFFAKPEVDKMHKMGSVVESHEKVFGFDVPINKVFGV